METARDKPVQRKQDAGEEFPFWVINIDKDECESRRWISQGDSQRKKENQRLKRLKKYVLELGRPKRNHIQENKKKDETK